MRLAIWLLSAVLSVLPKIYSCGCQKPRSPDVHLRPWPPVSQDSSVRTSQAILPLYPWLKPLNSTQYCYPYAPGHLQKYWSFWFWRFHQHQRNQRWNWFIHRLLSRWYHYGHYLISNPWCFGDLKKLQITSRKLTLARSLIRPITFPWYYEVNLKESRNPFNNKSLGCRQIWNLKPVNSPQAGMLNSNVFEEHIPLCPFNNLQAFLKARYAHVGHLEDHLKLLFGIPILPLFPCYPLVRSNFVTLKKGYENHPKDLSNLYFRSVTPLKCPFMYPVKNIYPFNIINPLKYLEQPLISPISVQPNFSSDQIFVVPTRPCRRPLPLITPTRFSTRTPTTTVYPIFQRFPQLLQMPSFQMFNHLHVMPLHRPNKISLPCIRIPFRLPMPIWNNQNIIHLLKPAIKMIPSTKCKPCMPCQTPFLQKSVWNHPKQYMTNQRSVINILPRNKLKPLVTWQSILQPILQKKLPRKLINLPISGCTKPSSISISACSQPMLSNPPINPQLFTSHSLCTPMSVWVKAQKAAPKNAEMVQVLGTVPQRHVPCRLIAPPISVWNELQRIRFPRHRIHFVPWFPFTQPWNMHKIFFKHPFNYFLPYIEGHTSPVFITTPIIPLKNRYPVLCKSTPIYVLKKNQPIMHPVFTPNPESTFPNIMKPHRPVMLIDCKENNLQHLQSPSQTPVISSLYIPEEKLYRSPCIPIEANKIKESICNRNSRQVSNLPPAIPVQHIRKQSTPWSPFIFPTSALHKTKLISRPFLTTQQVSPLVHITKPCCPTKSDILASIWKKPNKISCQALKSLRVFPAQPRPLFPIPFPVFIHPCKPFLTNLARKHFFPTPSITKPCDLNHRIIYLPVPECRTMFFPIRVNKAISVIPNKNIPKLFAPGVASILLNNGKIHPKTWRPVIIPKSGVTITRPPKPCVHILPITIQESVCRKHNLVPSPVSNLSPFISANQIQYKFVPSLNKIVPAWVPVQVIAVKPVITPINNHISVFNKPNNILGKILPLNPAYYFLPIGKTGLPTGPVSACMKPNIASPIVFNSPSVTQHIRKQVMPSPLINVPQSPFHKLKYTVCSRLSVPIPPTARSLVTCRPKRLPLSLVKLPNQFFQHTFVPTLAIQNKPKPLLRCQIPYIHSLYYNRPIKPLSIWNNPNIITPQVYNLLPVTPALCGRKQVKPLRKNEMGPIIQPRPILPLTQTCLHNPVRVWKNNKLIPLQLLFPPAIAMGKNIRKPSIIKPQTPVCPVSKPRWPIAIVNLPCTKKQNLIPPQVKCAPPITHKPLSYWIPIKPCSPVLNNLEQVLRPIITPLSVFPVLPIHEPCPPIRPILIPESAWSKPNLSLGKYSPLVSATQGIRKQLVPLSPISVFNKLDRTLGPVMKAQPIITVLPLSKPCLPIQSVNKPIWKKLTLIQPPLLYSPPLTTIQNICKPLAQWLPITPCIPVLKKSNQMLHPTVTTWPIIPALPSSQPCLHFRYYPNQISEPLAVCKTRNQIPRIAFISPLATIAQDTSKCLQNWLPKRVPCTNINRPADISHAENIARIKQQCIKSIPISLQVPSLRQNRFPYRVFRPTPVNPTQNKRITLYPRQTSVASLNIWQISSPKTTPKSIITTQPCLRINIPALVWIKRNIPCRVLHSKPAISTEHKPTQLVSWLPVNPLLSFCSKSNQRLHSVSPVLSIPGPCLHVRPSFIPLSVYKNSDLITCKHVNLPLLTAAQDVRKTIPMSLFNKPKEIARPITLKSFIPFLPIMLPCPPSKHIASPVPWWKPIDNYHKIFFGPISINYFPNKRKPSVPGRVINKPSNIVCERPRQSPFPNQNIIQPVPKPCLHYQSIKLPRSVWQKRIFTPCHILNSTPAIPDRHVLRPLTPFLPVDTSIVEKPGQMLRSFVPASSVVGPSFKTKPHLPNYKPKPIATGHTVAISLNIWNRPKQVVNPVIIPKSIIPLPHVPPCWRRPTPTKIFKNQKFIPHLLSNSPVVTYFQLIYKQVPRVSVLNFKQPKIIAPPTMFLPIPKPFYLTSIASSKKLICIPREVSRANTIIYSQNKASPLVLRHSNTSPLNIWNKSNQIVSPTSIPKLITFVQPVLKPCSPLVRPITYSVPIWNKINLIPRQVFIPPPALPAPAKPWFSINRPISFINQPKKIHTHTTRLLNIPNIWKRTNIFPRQFFSPIIPTSFVPNSLLKMHPMNIRLNTANIPNVMASPTVTPKPIIYFKPLPKIPLQITPTAVCEKINMIPRRPEMNGEKSNICHSPPFITVPRANWLPVSFPPSPSFPVFNKPDRIITHRIITPQPPFLPIPQQCITFKGISFPQSPWKRPNQFHRQCFNQVIPSLHTPSHLVPEHTVKYPLNFFKQPNLILNRQPLFPYASILTPCLHNTLPTSPVSILKKPRQFDFKNVIYPSISIPQHISKQVYKEITPRTIAELKTRLRKQFKPQAFKPSPVASVYNLTKRGVTWLPYTLPILPKYKPTIPPYIRPLPGLTANHINDLLIMKKPKKMPLFAWPSFNKFNRIAIPDLQEKVLPGQDLFHRFVPCLPLTQPVTIWNKVNSIKLNAPNTAPRFPVQRNLHSTFSLPITSLVPCRPLLQSPVLHSPIIIPNNVASLMSKKMHTTPRIRLPSKVLESPPAFYIIPTTIVPHSTSIPCRPPFLSTVYLNNRSPTSFPRERWFSAQTPDKRTPSQTSPINGSFSSKPSAVFIQGISTPRTHYPSLRPSPNKYIPHFNAQNAYTLTPKPLPSYPPKSIHMQPCRGLPPSSLSQIYNNSPLINQVISIPVSTRAVAKYLDANSPKNSFIIPTESPCVRLRAWYNPIKVFKVTVTLDISPEVYSVLNVQPVTSRCPACILYASNPQMVAEVCKFHLTSNCKIPLVVNGQCSMRNPYATVELPSHWKESNVVVLWPPLCGA